MNSQTSVIVNRRQLKRLSPICRLPFDEWVFKVKYLHSGDDRLQESALWNCPRG